MPGKLGEMRGWRGRTLECSSLSGGRDEDKDNCAKIGIFSLSFAFVYKNIC
jgi:hypothetical protein